MTNDERICLDGSVYGFGRSLRSRFAPPSDAPEEMRTMIFLLDYLDLVRRQAEAGRDVLPRPTIAQGPL